MHDEVPGVGTPERARHETDAERTKEKSMWRRNEVMVGAVQLMRKERFSIIFAALLLLNLNSDKRLIAYPMIHRTAVMMLHPALLNPISTSKSEVPEAVTYIASSPYPVPPLSSILCLSYLPNARSSDFVDRGVILHRESPQSS